MLRMIQAHTQLHRGVLLMNVSSDFVDKSVERELYAICDIVMELEGKGELGSILENAGT